MGRKTIRDQIRQKDAALKHAENRIKELKTTLNTKNREIKELQKHLTAERVSTNHIEQTIGAKTQDFDQTIKKMERIKKELTLKDQEQSATNLALAQRERELDSLKKAMKAQEQALLTQIQEKQKEAQQLFVSKEDEMAALGASLDAKKMDLRKEREENERIRKQMEDQGEQLKSMRFLVSEKEREIKEIHDILDKKEQAFQIEISEKDAEISSIKRCLMVAKKELQLIKGRTFWQKFKVCFQNE